ncbi:bacteriophage Mu GP30-like protein [Roseovarius sp. 217]|nr:bacteriophage Mu GP30-like protein [Roseovarius sp. 217]
MPEAALLWRKTVADLSTTFRRPFREQIAAFRLRLGDLVPTARWDDITRAQHDRAFMVAGAQKADLLADLAAAVDKAISQGTSLEEFRRDFRATVTRRGWHGWTGEGSTRGEAWRTRVIYRTNIATSYAAGRIAQLIEGNFAFWVYRHGGSTEPRVIHLGWDGLVLPPDHPFWITHGPPNGWGCSCYVIGARSEDGARRRGGDPDKRLPNDWQSRDPRTGAPKGIDKGWDYTPGASVADDIRTMAAKVVDWRYNLAVAYMTSLPDRTRDLLIEGYRGLPSLADHIRRYAARVEAANTVAARRTISETEPIQSLGLMTTAQARLYREGAQRDLDRYDVAIDADAIRHVFARHGNREREAARGQIAVTPADLGRLPEMFQNPDSFEWMDARSVQSRVLRLTKAIGARRYIAHFVLRPRRQRLVLLTYWVENIG